MVDVLWTADRIAAVVTGASLCGFLYVFFFGKRRETAARTTSPEAQEITIAVAGAYDPDVIVAKKGIPLKLIFDRRENNPCSDEVILPEFGIRRELPAFAKTEIDIVPDRIGEFPFHCGMNMLHGRIKVVDSS